MTLQSISNSYSPYFHSANDPLFTPLSHHLPDYLSFADLMTLLQVNKAFYQRFSNRVWKIQYSRTLDYLRQLDTWLNNTDYAPNNFGHIPNSGPIEFITLLQNLKTAELFEICISNNNKNSTQEQSAYTHSNYKKDVENVIEILKPLFSDETHNFGLHLHHKCDEHSPMPIPDGNQTRPLYQSIAKLFSNTILSSAKTFLGDVSYTTNRRLNPFDTIAETTLKLFPAIDATVSQSLTRFINRSNVIDSWGNLLKLVWKIVFLQQPGNRVLGMEAWISNLNARRATQYTIDHHTQAWNDLCDKMQAIHGLFQNGEHEALQTELQTVYTILAELSCATEKTRTSLLLETITPWFKELWFKESTEQKQPQEDENPLTLKRICEWFKEWEAKLPKDVIERIKARPQPLRATFVGFGFIPSKRKRAEVPDQDGEALPEQNPKRARN